MGRNLQLALTLFAKDTASKVLRKAMQDTIAQTKAVEKADDQLGKSQKQNADTAIRSSRTLQQEWQRASSARSTLGIRSEREIQREIQQTQAAYNRLTRTGTLSANEQSRAFAAMTERVSKLRGELNSTGQTMSRLDRAKGIGSNAMAIAGGITAAGAVVAQPVNNQMSYERKLADMSNTAFAEEGKSGRIAGMKSMDSLIRETVKSGGGTKDSAADTLNALLASGAVDFDSVKTLLPVIQKYASASGADPKDLANIAIRLKQSFSIQDKDIGKALNMAIYAGQAGSFELNDMAKYLPAQLAGASNLGMKGLGDFSTLLGLNQAAAITAGDSSQAGTNVTDLLLKINSKDAATAAARIKINGKGIDLPGSIAAARGKGINPIDAFSSIVSKVVSSNPAYQKLDEKLKTATGGERQQIMEAQRKILEGSGIGKMIADQQALMALVGYRANNKYAKEVISGANDQVTLPDGKRAGDLNFDLVSDTNDFKTDQLKNARDFSEMDSIKPLSDVLGGLAKELTDYSDKYPSLTIALSGATTGIKAMGAAAAVFAGIRFLSGGGAGGAAGAGAAGGAAGRILGGGGIMVPALAITATSVAISTTRDILREDFSKKTMPEKVDSLSAGTSGYSFVDVAWEVLKNRISGDGSSIKKPSDITANHTDPLPMGTDSAGFGVPSYLKPQTQAAPFLPIQINTKLELDGKVVAETTNEVNANQANRGSTGNY